MIRRRLLPSMLMLMIMAAPPARAQTEKEQPSIPFDGPEVFAYLLKVRGYTPIPTIEERKQHAPADTLIVLFGKLDAAGQVLAELRQFQIDGGSVLLASDYARSLPDYGVHIVGKPVKWHDEGRYRDTPECPLIKTLQPNVPSIFRPLAHGLATNRPSYFKLTRRLAISRRPPLPPPVLQPLAGFKLQQRIIGSGQPEEFEHDQLMQDGILADGISVLLPYAYLADRDANAAGRALLIAGHGSFTNCMLLRQDNENFPFATQCLDWLGNRPDGTLRRHALFIVNGVPVDDFDAGLKPPPLPVPPIPAPTIAVANHLIQGIEQEGILIRILDQSVDVRSAVRYGLMLVTLLLLCYGAKKLTEQRHHTERGSALLAGPFAVPADIAPLVVQRGRSQIEHNALGVEARALARAWFLEMCAIPIADWDRASATPAPAALVAGGWWQRHCVRRQIGRLTQLAGQGIPASFAWTDMVRLTRTLQTLSAAMREGRLRFAGCSDGENS